MTKSVLTKDLHKKQILDEFLQHCEKKQVEALQNHNPYQFCTWIKEARLARRELAALYLAKEKHNEEHTRIRGIVHRLRSVGVNADVVGRVHYITLSEEVS
ncbi:MULTISPECIES: hypothetical protein [Bacillus]|uniref:Uncharacterized protein n=1 Tax=Bacillus thuringiensis YBT-1518 TaxID=529122 RepID=A0A9W3PIN6_BACTU|nr:hypothetical protein [Bacillus thuringiensis]EKS8368973.1 hypothetical protein [Bacillus cereus]AHA74585.1 hypothetical protein YBT1518_27400 [Bacillus thuringiensis YBT-1518]MBG9486673.1 hypothetical protein [Bacillus thuringiensis]MBG9497562.1 hypothetical protein [Bacillus thuringiensis]MBG9504137.1 hypothetical protein [Bacillus thuringiensis]